VGSFKSNSFEKQMWDHYFKRIKTFKVILKEIPHHTTIDGEANLIIKSLSPANTIIGLDMEGDNVTSPDIANLLTQSSTQWIIGGHAGLHPTVLKKCSKIISFGRITWPHLMMRGLLLEQIYRSQQIFNNHPYHQN
jgi:23S rRNA (pseudouridine1915-N3)-methyltransferase